MQDYCAARAPEYDRICLKPERQADLRRIEQWLAGVAPLGGQVRFREWPYFWALEYTSA